MLETYRKVVDEDGTEEEYVKGMKYEYPYMVHIELSKKKVETENKRDFDTLKEILDMILEEAHAKEIRKGWYTPAEGYHKYDVGVGILSRFDAMKFPMGLLEVWESFEWNEEEDAYYRDDWKRDLKNSYHWQQG